MRLTTLNVSSLRRIREPLSQSGLQRLRYLNVQRPPGTLALRFCRNDATRCDDDPLLAFAVYRQCQISGGVSSATWFITVVGKVFYGFRGVIADRASTGYEDKYRYKKY